MTVPAYDHHTDTMRGLLAAYDFETDIEATNNQFKSRIVDVFKGYGARRQHQRVVNGERFFRVVRTDHGRTVAIVADLAEVTPILLADGTAANRTSWDVVAWRVYQPSTTGTDTAMAIDHLNALAETHQRELDELMFGWGAEEDVIASLVGAESSDFEL